jgi:hypothetical protein
MVFLKKIFEKMTPKIEKIMVFLAHPVWKKLLSPSENTVFKCQNNFTLFRRFGAWGTQSNKSIEN